MPKKRRKVGKGLNYEERVARRTKAEAWARQKRPMSVVDGPEPKSEETRLDEILQKELREDIIEDMAKDEKAERADYALFVYQASAMQCSLIVRVLKTLGLETHWMGITPDAEGEDNGNEHPEEVSQEARRD